MNDKEIIIPTHLPLEKQLTYVIDEGSYTLTESLLNQGADPSSNDNEAIRIAVEKNYTDIIKLLLLDKRVDPNASTSGSMLDYIIPRSVIGLAAMNGNIEIIQLLIDLGVDINVCDSEAIHSAAKYGVAETFKLLYSLGGYPESHPLFGYPTQEEYNLPNIVNCALSGGNLEIIKILLDDPSTNLEKIDNWHCSIEEASHNKRIEAFKLCYSWYKKHEKGSLLENDEKYKKLFKEIESTELKDQVITLLTLRSCNTHNYITNFPLEIILYEIAQQYQGIVIKSREDINQCIQNFNKI